MRIASPCPMNWDGMKGDNRARFCDLCSLHVYNISEMTRREVETLIAETEGRICARLFKRADGTVLTKDCTVGLRAIRRRVSRVAGAVVTATFSVCMSAFGRTSQDNLRPGPLGIRISATNLGIAPQPGHAEISGRVLDPNGEPISGAIVTITNQDTGKKSKVETKAKGTFRFLMLTAGPYTIEVEASYFDSYQRTDLKLGASDTLISSRSQNHGSSSSGHSLRACG